MVALDAILAALALPPECLLNQRVPKKLLVENGAPTPADKRHINDDIEELLWLTALKPSTIGVPEFRDPTREYLEIAVLCLRLRDSTKTLRLAELLHRAIPYPVFLIQLEADSTVLSLAHLRWSQGQSGKTVLDGPIVTAALDPGTPATASLLASLAAANQPRQHLYAFYQGWLVRFETHAAARLTGRFAPALDPAAAEARRAALAEHDRLTGEIAALRARAAKETQLSRRVELNLEIKHHEAALADLTTKL